jgi:hypothetical protein
MGFLLGNMEELFTEDFEGKVSYQGCVEESSGNRFLSS